MTPLTAETIRAHLSGLDTGPFGADVRYFPRIGSTSDLARELAGQGAPEGTLVIADEQTAGRGRMGRAWVAPPGSSLMATAIFRPSLPPALIYRLVIACGLAAAEGCETLLPVRVDVKWPNDLQIAGKKLAGILPESSLIGDRIEWAIVGMGINVSQHFEGELAATATSLARASGAAPDRLALLGQILVRLNAWNSRLSDPALLDSWRARCVTLGQTIEVEVNGNILSGAADEIDETGALWLRGEDGLRRQLTISEAHILGRSGKGADQ